MANPGLDNQLQAIALGANLANQRRMYEVQRQQMNMQAADRLMRMRQQDMAMKVQELRLADAMREQEAQIRDMPRFQEFQNQVATFLNDPSGQIPFPSVPPLESRSLAVTASQTMQGLDQYSARARQMKALQDAQKVQSTIQTQELEQLTRMAGELATLGVQVPTNFAGVGQNGELAINQDAAKVIRDQYVATMGAEAQRKAMADYSTMANKGSLTEDQANQLLAQGNITREQHKSLVASIKATGGPATQKERGIESQISALRASGAITSQGDEVQARAVLAGPLEAYAGDTKIRGAFNSQLKSVRSLEEVFNQVRAFEDKHGAGSLKTFTGPLDSNIDDVTRRLRGYEKRGKLTASDVADAQRIFKTIESVIADYRFGLFGASLTTGEKEAMEKLVSNRNRADYLDAINDFRTTLEGGVRRYISEYPFNYMIPVNARRDYGPSGTVTEVQAETVPVPGSTDFQTTPSGIRFRIKQ